MSDVHRHDEVRVIQVDHLASVRLGENEEITKKLCDKIDEKIDAYGNGDLPHAAEAVSLLWEVSKKSRHMVSVPQGANISVSLAPQYPPATNQFRLGRVHSPPATQTVLQGR